MNRTQKISGIVAVFVVLMGIFLFVPRHTSRGVSSGTIYIDTSFDKVRRILVLNDSLKEMVALQHGEVLHNEWETLRLSSDRLLTLDWDIDGVGNFVVRTQDPNAGELILNFEQKVEVRKDCITSKTRLKKAVGPLQEYDMDLRLSRDGERTKVKLTVSLRYSRKLPRTHIDYMNDKVQSSADQGWEKGINGLVQIIEKNNRLFTIPIIR